jgi:hypothetical protein
VGGLVGASLAHEGEQVTLLLRPESLAQHPAYLRLEGPTGDFEAAVRIDAELREPVDVLWVTVKAYQLVAALQAVLSNGSSIGTIVPLLNGIDHVTLLRSRFDPKGVVPGTIAVESERVAPGHIIQRSPFARLALSATGERQLEGVAALLRRAASLVNFKRTRKRYSGANSRSWRHSRSPPPREIRASRRFAPTLRGGHGSNQRYARPAPLRPRMGRLSITQESWRPSNRYLQRCEARCKRTCRPVGRPNSTQ